MSWDLPVYVASLIAALAGSFALGRRTASAKERIRDLEAKVEGLCKQHELAAAEAEAAKDELRLTRREHSSYRTKVVDHFSGTSELLRDLTLRYRAVYDHLAQSAGELCPEGFEILEGRFGEDALPGRAGARAEAARAASKADGRGADQAELDAASNP